MKNKQYMTLIQIGLGLLIGGSVITLSSLFLYHFDRPEPEPEPEPAVEMGFTIRSTDGSMGFSSMTIILHEPLLLDVSKGGFIDKCTIKPSPKFKGSELVIVKGPRISPWKLPITESTFPPLPEGVRPYTIIWDVE